MEKLSEKRRQLLKACHLKLTGKLEMTAQEMAEQFGYCASSIRNVLGRVKTGNLSEQSKNYLSQQFPSEKAYEYLKFSRPTSEKRKKMLEACYLKLTGELNMTAEEIAKQTGYEGQSVRFTLSCMHNNKLSAPDMAYVKERFPNKQTFEKNEISRQSSERRKALLDLCCSILDDELDITTKEIAKQLGYSEGYVRSTLSRMRNGKISGTSRAYLEERRQMRYQALNIADMVQSYFCKNGSWLTVTLDEIDEIQRQYQSTQLVNLDQELGKATSVYETEQLMNRYKRGLGIINMALNVVNQRIDMKNDLESIPSKIDFCPVYKPASTATEEKDIDIVEKINPTLTKERI